MNITGEQAESYLTDAGYSFGDSPEYSDSDWIRIIGFLVAYGFIEKIDWESEIGQTMLGVISDVFQKYEAWREAESENVPEPE